MPVRFSGLMEIVEVDEGATISLIDEELASTMGVIGVKHDLRWHVLTITLSSIVPRMLILRLVELMTNHYMPIMHSQHQIIQCRIGNYE